MQCTFFCQFDLARKNTSMFDTVWGQFLITGVTSTTAWMAIWPLEVLKNMAQAETQGVGNTMY